jgi:hypothetical protein
VLSAAKVDLGHRLRDGGEHAMTEIAVSVDSTIVWAHQHAAGTRRDSASQLKPPGVEPADHAPGLVPWWVGHQAAPGR